MHRDYQSNMPIRLYQFDDHIEIMNAGGLYGEARPENFPNVNDYRNPIVAEAMKEMKYVNMFNQGIRRVQDMLKENGNNYAVFDVSKLTAFTVNVFSSVDDTQDENQSDIHDDTQLGLPNNCPETAQKLPRSCPEVAQNTYMAIINHPDYTIKMLADYTNQSERTIKNHQSILKEAGLIVRVGSDRNGYWKILDQ